MDAPLALGLDFGTDSVRAVIADTTHGNEVAEGVSPYLRWSHGLACNPPRSQYRQHPRDYLESMESAVRAAIEGLPAGTSERIIGIGVATTGSTVCAIDATGTPLAITRRFESDPDAMFFLWKDHVAVAEAEEITHRAKTWGGPDVTIYSGGVYSSEWFFAKILHVLRHNEAVARAAESFVELCDFVPAVLAGVSDARNIVRSRCAAGHKALYHAAWGGLPPADFLRALHPELAALRSRLYERTETSDRVAGTLCGAWADKLRLRRGTPIAVGAFDAHMGAVAAGVRAGRLVRVMGTSTCDMMVAPREEHELPVPGICGQVEGSILPGMLGLEAGQSAFGDVFGWLTRFLRWGVPEDAALEAKELLPALEAASSQLAPGESGLLALDWFNGRRTPFADATVTSAITGLTLATSPVHVHRALIEALAYGSRAIVDQFETHGHSIDSIVGVGGLAHASPLLMQTLADVLDRPIEVPDPGQTCARGAAIFAATVGGAHPDVFTAQRAMEQKPRQVYRARPKAVEAYRELYARYRTLGAATHPSKRES